MLLAALLAAATLTGHAQDPADRPQDPPNDVRLVTTTYDSAGTWTVAVRFDGKPTPERHGFLRVHLVERIGGACSWDATRISMAAYTNPADPGGRGYVEGRAVDLAKTNDGDGLGFTLRMSDPALASREACGANRITLSAGEPYDTVADIGFEGERPPDPPPGEDPPAGDGTPPSAAVTLLRSRADARRGRVRVRLVGASEAAGARVTLYASGRFAARRTVALTAGGRRTIALRLDDRLRRRLRRSGRLPVRVVAVLSDATGNRVTLRRRASLRTRSS